ncbi:hypothetical protein BDW71DRAFT_203176 [Aspergillus fruticulosus]
MHSFLYATLFTTLFYFSPNTLVSASPAMPAPTMDAALTIPPSLIGALAHPLTCVQLSTMNSKLDGLIHYAFPAAIRKEAAYAVASFTHAYKVLVNTMHGGDCAVANDDMEFNMTMFESGLNSKSVKRQDDTDITAILCVIIDTLLGDNGGEAIPTGGGGTSAARLPSVTVTVSQDMVKETGASMSAVKRQDNNGDEGIVEDLLELVGTILQILLGCDIGDDSEDGGGSGSASI